MKSQGTPLWNKSLMEHTKMRRGFFQRKGSSRTSGWQDTTLDHVPSGFVAKAYLGLLDKRLDIVSA